MARAVDALSRREYSRLELTRRLMRSLAEGETFDDVEDVVGTLEKRGYLSDERYAQTRVRVRSERYGNRRLAHELRMMGVDGDSSNPVPTSNNTVSREEYKFSLFINRLRTVFKELLVKPMWMQFCLKYPAFATNNVLRSALGLSYVEENLFVLAKERAIIADGAALVQNLSGINGADGRPVFSMRFLVKYLGLSDDD